MLFPQISGKENLENVFFVIFNAHRAKQDEKNHNVV